MEWVVILSLVMVAIVGAGGMWLSWQDGYDKGFTDAAHDAVISRLRAMGAAQAAGDYGDIPVDTIDPLDGGRNDR